MFRLHLSTAGESHGPAELGVLSGVPALMPLSAEDIDAELARRQRGYGRGARQQIESDTVEILGGVRHGRTTGGPLAFLVRNRDHENWLPTMSREATDEDDTNRVTVPRPGHADLAGMTKYGFEEARDVLERSSARATVPRVCAGAVARRLLHSLGVSVKGRVVSIGSAADTRVTDLRSPESIDWKYVEESATAAAHPEADERMRAAVDAAAEDGVSLGGVFEIWVIGAVPGLGNYVRPEERLDGRLAGAVMAVPAIKGVEIGAGFSAAALRGTDMHDEIFASGGRGDGGTEDMARDSSGIRRGSNNAGGLEGGMSTGLPIVLRGAMKPIPTMRTALRSIRLPDRRPADAHRERADVEAVPAARVVAEAEVALVVADAYLQKFGGDSLPEVLESLERYRRSVSERGLWPSSR